MDPHSALNSLKVKELQQICKEHGLGLQGRKGELIERLVNFRASLSAQSRRERATGAPNAVAASPGSASPQSRGPYGSPEAAAPRPRSGRGRGSRPRGGGGAGGRNAARSQAAVSTVRSPASVRQEPQAMHLQNGVGAGDRAAGPPIAAVQERPLKCTKCGLLCDLAEQSYQVKFPSQFACPECRFKEMDPFHPVVQGNQGMLHTARPSAQGKLEFVLELPNLRQWRREGLIVSARMVNVGACKVHHAWPNTMRFWANNTEVFIIEPPEEGHKRRDVPMDVSHGLRPGRNEVRLQIQDEHPTDFLLGLVLTQPVGLEELQEQVRSVDAGAGRARVCELLARKRGGARVADVDDIVCLAPDTLKLRCPITMDRPEAPARGAECQHLQCFGLEAFLQINRQMRAFNNRWVCPVCTLVLRPPDLVIDEYIHEITSKTPEEVEEVVLAPDGTWSLPTPVRKRPKPEQLVAAKAASPVSLATLPSAARSGSTPPVTPPPTVGVATPQSSGKAPSSGARPAAQAAALHGGLGLRGNLLTARPVDNGSAAAAPPARAVRSADGSSSSSSASAAAPPNGRAPRGGRQGLPAVAGTTADTAALLTAAFTATAPAARAAPAAIQAASAAHLAAPAHAAAQAAAQAAAEPARAAEEWPPGTLRSATSPFNCGRGGGTARSPADALQGQPLAEIWDLGDDDDDDDDDDDLVIEELAPVAPVQEPELKRRRSCDDDIPVMELVQ